MTWGKPGFPAPRELRLRRAKPAPIWDVLRRAAPITGGYRPAMDEVLVINLAKAPAMGHPRMAAFIKLEPEGVVWPDTGINVQIMSPESRTAAITQSRRIRRTFSSCTESASSSSKGEERLLRQRDFLHCPAGTAHVFVGAGDGPCAVLMIGARRENACHYTVNEVAAKYDASVTQKTDEPAQAYADWLAETQPAPMRNPWPLS
jgi:hypothetical protein